MAEASDTWEFLRQGLVDAGCEQETIQMCMELAWQEKTGEMRRILARHRQALLEALHADEKRIDCLDYLVYNMEKQAK